MTKLTGYTREEILVWDPKEFRAIIYKEDFHVLQKFDERIIKEREGVVGEVRIHSKDSSLHWYHITTSILEFSDENQTAEIENEMLDYIYGKPQLVGYSNIYGFPKVLGTFINIDNRKKLELFLQESEEKYRLLVSTLPDLIIIHRDTKIIYVNNTVIDVTGYLEKELLEHSIFEFVTEKYHDILQKNYERRMKGELVEDYELEIITKSGERKQMLVRAALIKMKDETAIMSVLNDITVYKSREELRLYSKVSSELQEKERKRIAREIHDSVIQILITAKMHLDTMESRHSNEYKRTLEDTIKQLNGAITELRRISHNLHPIFIEDIGLEEAIKSMLKNFEKRTSIQVVIGKDEFCDKISSDFEINIYRIIQEIINNIERHSEATDVNIDFECIENSFIIKVRDNGKGFDVDKSIQIVGEEVKYVIRNIRERVDLLNGSYEINSAPGKGTEIIVKVPKTI
jgi:PAS domain S-box-containing protein